MSVQHLRLPADLTIFTAIALCLLAAPSSARQSPEVTLRMNNMMHNVDRALMQMRLLTNQLAAASARANAGAGGDELPAGENGKYALTVPPQHYAALQADAKAVAETGHTVLLMLSYLDAEVRRVLLDFRSQAQRLPAVVDQLGSAGSPGAEFSALEKLRRAIESAQDISRRYWQVSATVRR